MQSGHYYDYEFKLPNGKLVKGSDSEDGRVPDYLLNVDEEMIFGSVNMLLAHYLAQNNHVRLKKGFKQLYSR